MKDQVHQTPSCCCPQHEYNHNDAIILLTYTIPIHIIMILSPLLILQLLGVALWAGFSHAIGGSIIGTHCCAAMIWDRISATTNYVSYEYHSFGTFRIYVFIYMHEFSQYIYMPMYGGLCTRS